MLYLLDTNVFIDAKNWYYPFDRVPQFWDWILDRARSSEIKIPFEIMQEIEAGSTQDDLSKWAKANKSTLLLNEQATNAHLNTIKSQGYGTNLSSADLTTIGKDPFLMAYAMVDTSKRCVVTTEASKPSRKGINRHIPDVCNQFGISCINTFQLIRSPLDFRIPR